mgnify:CR=1 FL=1
MLDKQANTSKHLSKFKELNILSSQREGNLIKYSIKEEFLNFMKSKSIQASFHYQSLHKSKYFYKN